MNTSLWDAHFALPKVGSTLCAVDKGTFMEDWDIGYTLSNFMLRE